MGVFILVMGALTLCIFLFGNVSISSNPFACHCDPHHFHRKKQICNVYLELSVLPIPIATQMPNWNGSQIHFGLCVLRGHRPDKTFDLKNKTQARKRISKTKEINLWPFAALPLYVNIVSSCANLHTEKFWRIYQLDTCTNLSSRKIVLIYLKTVLLKVLSVFDIKVYCVPISKKNIIFFYPFSPPSFTNL